MFIPLNVYSRPYLRRALSRTFIGGLVAFTTISHAQVIRNGSFESPVLADGTFYFGSATSWTGGAFVDNPNAAGGLLGLGFTWPQAADGQQYVDIGDVAAYAVSQTFTVTDAGTVTIGWADNTALNIVPGYKTAPYSVRLVDGSSAEVFSQSLDSYHDTGLWQFRSVDLFVPAGTYSISFTSLNVYNGTDTLIDAVQISAVPEASSAYLVSIGLLSMLGYGSLRRRATKGCAPQMPDR